MSLLEKHRTFKKKNPVEGSYTTEETRLPLKEKFWTQSLPLALCFLDTLWWTDSSPSILSIMCCDTTCQDTKPPWPRTLESWAKINSFLSYLKHYVLLTNRLLTPGQDVHCTGFSGPTTVKEEEKEGIQDEKGTGQWEVSEKLSWFCSSSKARVIFQSCLCTRGVTSIQSNINQFCK